jgi:vancomycin resistance protein YoaR
LAVFLGGLLLYLGMASFWVIGYQLVYAGRIFPGVSVGGVDLSGMARDQAALKLSETLSYPVTGKVMFRQGDKAWVSSPVQLGMVFDPSASARAAYNLGRTGGLFAALDDQIWARSLGYDVAPVLIFDQRVAYQYLQGLAQQVDQPVIEGTLQIEGANVTAVPGRTGRTVNIAATLRDLSSQLQTFRDGEVGLAVQEVQPSIADASSQADVARQILSQPLQLTVPNAQPGDPGPWVYQSEVLANLIGIQQMEKENSYTVQVSLNPDTLQQMLTAIEPQVDRPAANARFHFDDSTGQLVALSKSFTGRKLDMAASVKAINDALLRGEHSVPLVVTETQPVVADTATAQQLGITGLLPNGVQTSFFYGSHAERVQNITTAAARFDGVLVAPGETFSMGDTLGDVSLDNGYAEAPIIYGGRTIQGVGGGVCQVSTTLFRTVFFAGFPVVQRVPHAYRVSYYEQTASGRDASLAGLDATVFFPLVDFKFTNDSPYWLLMETSVSGYSLTWKLYSTDDGRAVKWSTTGPQNIVPAPDASFQPNPDLNAGQITQTDYAANGADVTVSRTVLKNGAIYYQDQFQTQYQAWQAVCEYAPGMPDPEKVAKRQGLCQSPSS